MARTQEEILAKFRSVSAEGGLFDFRPEVLAESMDLPTLKQVLPDYEAENPGTTFPLVPVDTLDERARGYLAFAITKALDHRGLSAGRSVQKLEMYAWLMGKDDVVTAMDEAGYTNYGVPKLKAFAEGMGYPFTVSEYYEQAELDRMAEGKRCREDCEEGCG